jgi:hypothetical protein
VRHTSSATLRSSMVAAGDAVTAELPVRHPFVIRPSLHEAESHRP